MSVCLFTCNNSIAKWLFIAFDIVVVLLKYDKTFLKTGQQYVFLHKHLKSNYHITRCIFTGARCFKNKLHGKTIWLFYAHHPVSVHRVVFKIIKHKGVKKVKVTIEEAMKLHRVSRGIAYSSCNHTPATVLPGRETRYLL
jgi:hypothetical protein